MAFEVKSTNDIINDMIVDIVTNVTQVSDINTGSVLRQLVEALGDELGEIYSDLSDVYDGTRILTAAADDLENLAAIVGITRNAGTNASGTITFLREQVASADFTITAGTIVSTDPGTGETQYRFTVDSDTTFDSEIVEAITFKDGIFKYALSERFSGSVTSITGTSGSVASSFTETTDFTVTEVSGLYLSDAATVVDIDTCDAVTGWSESTDAIAEVLNTSDEIEGTGCLDLGKSGTSSTTAYYQKTLSAAVDLSDLRIFLGCKAIDTTALNKIAAFKIRLSSDSTPTNNYYEYDIIDDLDTTFDLKSFAITDATSVGSPNIEAINSVRITIETNNSSDTLSSGDVLIDFFHASQSDTAYYGDIIQWIDGATIPDDATSFTTTWKPLSVDVAVTAEEVGDEYNVAAGSIIYKVSVIANINSVYNYYALSSGTDEETDDALRTRVQNAASAAGKATAEAIRQAILDVDGVTSVRVVDMPTTDVYGPSGTGYTSEFHIMNTTSAENKLNYEVVYLDDATSPTNIIISDDHDDNVADWTYGTDYTVSTTTNKISWLDTATPGTTCPSNGAAFYVGYQHQWLGHVQVYVAGVGSPLSSTIQTNVDTAITNSKAAGINVVWAEPTRVDINIEVTLTVDTAGGYSASSVQENVQTTIISWLNAKEIGEDVLVAELYDEVMDVAGVTNVVINDWDGDTSAPFSDITIADSEIARPEDSGIIVN